jgi:hypothetical protein
MIMACSIRKLCLHSRQHKAFAALAMFLALAVASVLQCTAQAGKPVVTFTLDFPASDPSHYSIIVGAEGHGIYECTVKLDNNSDPDTYRTEFILPAAALTRIFDQAKQANYFSEKVDSGNRKLAFTGDKVLSYRDGAQSSSAHYNFSNLEPVRQLTAFFQKLQATLDYGRRITYDHRYQKLALDDELKHMEAQAKSDELVEIESVVPVLQEVAADPSVINGVRARAKGLIQMSTVPGR